MARRSATWFAVLFVVLLAAVGPGAAARAAAPAPTPSAVGGSAVGGILRQGQQAVAGVGITVIDEAGATVGEATSDDRGVWRVPVAARGTYRVELDPDTLPPGVALAQPDRNPLQVTVPEGLQQTVIFLLRDEAASTGEQEPSSRLDRLPQALVHGLKTGLIIAIAAVGLSLIYGTTRQINFAHGEMLTLGAVIAWFLNARGPMLPLVVAAAIAIVAVGLVGGALERGLWRPVRARNAGRFQLLIISVGLSLVLRHLILMVYGGNGQTYQSFQVQEPWALGPISISPRDLGVMLISVAVLVSIGLMLQKTPIGKATRAVADNFALAEMSGIDVKRVVLVVWTMAGFLAALGGSLLGLVQGVTWDMGFQLLLLMFAGVVLGGLGTAYGTMVGSVIVGIIMEVSTLFFPSELKAGWALAVLIVILIVRPQGIFGMRERVG